MVLARQTIRDASTRVFGEAMIPRDPLTYGIAIRIRKDGANAKHVCSCALLDESGKIGRLGWMRGADAPECQGRAAQAQHHGAGEARRLNQGWHDGGQQQDRGQQDAR